MDIYFNELCLTNANLLEFQDIQIMGGLCAALIQRNIRTCRISVECYGKIVNDAKNVSGKDKNIVNMFFSFFKPPYESADVEEMQDEYYLHAWSCRGVNCYGLALAYIMDSMSLSVGDLWNQVMIEIEQDCNLLMVRNLFDECSLQYHAEWLGEKEEVELIASEFEPEKKKIKLRDDHGKGELYEFCKRLVKCEYVNEIINSMPFNSKNRRFIHKIRENGLIEIVLPWSDAGHGVVVKTTGRNRTETERIADILKDKYGAL